MSNFQDAMAKLGHPHVIHDGKIHRFRGAEDRAGSENCWYVSFGTAGAFGSWKLGFTETWHEKSDRSKEEDAALAKQIRAAQKQRKAETAQRQTRTQEKARYLWAAGSETILHTYPEKKQIIPVGTRQKDNRLLVPMYYQGQLWNIQQIQPDGTKRFLKGGRVSGCYMPIGTLSDHILVTEGYATGASLHEHTGLPVAVSFNAGNLKSVAVSVRQKHPEIQITIAADNDTGTPGNPGLTKAREAAAVAGGAVIYPDFSDEDFEGTDWNDYLTNGGLLDIKTVGRPHKTTAAEDPTSLEDT